jgi:hypothetical protein
MNYRCKNRGRTLQLYFENMRRVCYWYVNNLTKNLDIHGKVRKINFYFLIPKI